MPLFYPIFTCVDPDPYSQYGSTKLLNMNPDPQTDLMIAQITGGGVVQAGTSVQENKHLQDRDEQIVISFLQSYQPINQSTSQPTVASGQKSRC